MYNLLPYRYRSFLRLCIFFRNILNKSILNELYNELELSKHKSRTNEKLFIVPNGRTLAGSHRISIFLPECTNIIFSYSYLFNFCDFKTFILFNIGDCYQKFVSIRLKFKSIFKFNFFAKER